MKNLYKRWLIMGLSMSIFALAGMRRKLESQIDGDIGDTYGGPDQFPDPRVRPANVVPMPDSRPISATTVTFSGTVMRNGSRFVLRETGGVLYTLDSTGRAWPFEGEDVRVTGKLDTSTSLLHVDAIETMAS